MVVAALTVGVGVGVGLAFVLQMLVIARSRTNEQVGDLLVGQLHLHLIFLKSFYKNDRGGGHNFIYYILSKNNIFNYYFFI